MLITVFMLDPFEFFLPLLSFDVTLLSLLPEGVAVFFLVLRQQYLVGGASRFIVGCGRRWLMGWGDRFQLRLCCTRRPYTCCSGWGKQIERLTRELCREVVPARKTYFVCWQGVA